MGLFNNYFGSNEKKKRTELTVPQVMKFIQEASTIIDNDLIFKDAYNEFWSENDLNKMAFSEFRVNILVHTIFGFAHNDHYNIQENLYTMLGSNKERVYYKSYMALCTRAARSWRIIHEIHKYSDIKYEEESLRVIVGYTLDFIYLLIRFLEDGIRKSIVNEFDKEIITMIEEFKVILFLLNNPGENWPPYDLNYNNKYGLDEEKVASFAWGVMRVYKKAKNLLENGI